MGLVCQCGACHAKYQVGDQYAGRTIKCPKCAAAVVVPEAQASPTSSSKSNAASPAVAASPKPQTAEPKPSPAAGSPPPPLPSAADARGPDGTSESSSEGDELDFLRGQAAGSGSLPAKATAAAARPSKAAGVSAHRPKKKPAMPAWLVPAVGAGAALIIAAAAIGWYWFSQPKIDVPTASAPAADGKKLAQPESSRKLPVLRIQWEPNQRGGAAIAVNGDSVDLPASGKIEIPLRPAKEQYHVVLTRKGFKPKEFRLAVREDDVDYTVSEWEPDVQGIDWAQDFEEAKKRAAGQKKHVLVLFDASDAKESAFASSRFAESVASRKEFRDRCEKEYVAVYIDNPVGDKARKRVADLARNAALTKQYKITVLPTVVAMDAEGKPFGILEGYTINGVTAFLELMDKWQEDGKALLDMLKQYKDIAKDDGRTDLELAKKLVTFLRVNELSRFYPGTISKCKAWLPKDEESVVTKEDAELWMKQFSNALLNPDQVKSLVAKFDEWKKDRNFKDHDVGAQLHLAAALLLGRIQERDAATRKIKEAMAFEPRNPRLRAALEQIHEALTGEHRELPVGSGTGFCIAQGNYVLTNYHVVKGAKRLRVRLNGQDEKYPATVVAGNEKGDMALLKAEIPQGKKLAPIPLATAGVKIGEDVCVLGFPGVLSQNITLTLTKGVVSTIPDPRDDNGFIATDCKVNPGNSGGPLCSFSGHVAGMVTAKSQTTSREDSYGLVIPIDRVRKFLTANLPAGALPAGDDAAKSANLKLADLAERIAPSVVFIENLQ